MKKQLCSLLTALALAVGLLPPAARAAENAPSFADVPAAAWYADAVQYVYENGLMTGVSESEFAPDGTATRVQIVTILWRLAGSPVVNYAMRYADADEGAWYGEAVRWAASTGVVTGYTESSFGPNDAITREQLAAILYRYIKTQGQGFTGMWYFPLRYDDAASISDWADEAMHWCVMKGVLNGTGETTLSPQLTATRAQLAAILQRFCELPKDTASKSDTQTAYDRASAYLTAAVSAPRYGSLGGEWTVLALARGGADFAVFPECAVSGYPLGDLVGYNRFVEAAQAALASLAETLPIPAIVGCPRLDGGPAGARNSAYLLDGGKVSRICDKMLLPNRRAKRPAQLRPRARFRGRGNLREVGRGDDLRGHLDAPVAAHRAALRKFPEAA